MMLRYTVSDISWPR